MWASFRAWLRAAWTWCLYGPSVIKEMCCADWESPHWHLLWAVFPDVSNCRTKQSRTFPNIVITRWVCLRVLPGSMWEPISLSSRSPSGLPARFGPSPEMVLPFTEVLSAHRTQQVSGSETAIGNASNNNLLYFGLYILLQEIVGITSRPQPDRSWNRCLWAGPRCML